MSLSVLTTWVYNNTHRSIFSAILMHFMINATYGIIQQDRCPLPLSAFAAYTATIAIAAVIVTGLWGAKTMTLRGAGREDVNESSGSGSACDNGEEKK